MTIKNFIPFTGIFTYPIGVLLFRNKGVEELLMEKLLDFAKDKKVKNIVTYCGSEPFCPDGQVSMDEEVNFFEDHGFKLDHHVFGLVPCMIKTM